MKKQRSLLIIREYVKQVEWWNKIGRHLVSIDEQYDVINKDTNIAEFVLIMLKPRPQNWIVSKINSSFFKKPVTEVWKIEGTKIERSRV